MSASTKPSAESGVAGNHHLQPFRLRLFQQSQPVAVDLRELGRAFGVTAEHPQPHGQMEPAQDVPAAGADQLGERLDLVVAGEEGDLLVGLQALAFEAVSPAERVVIIRRGKADATPRPRPPSCNAGSTS